MRAQAPRALRSRSAPAKETTKYSQGGDPKLERGLSCAQDSSKSSQEYFCMAVDGGRASNQLEATCRIFSLAQHAQPANLKTFNTQYRHSNLLSSTPLTCLILTDTNSFASYQIRQLVVWN